MSGLEEKSSQEVAAAEGLAATDPSAALLEGSLVMPALVLATMAPSPGQLMFIEGQLVGDIAGLSDAAGAARAFKSF